MIGHSLPRTGFVPRRLLASRRLNVKPDAQERDNESKIELTSHRERNFEGLGEPVTRMIGTNKEELNSDSTEQLPKDT
jgi:hypothetical protein